jgi:hypothetical protein
VHYLPGLDATLRFRAAADGTPTLAWDSVFVAAPQVPRAAAP